MKRIILGFALLLFFSPAFAAGGNDDTQKIFERRDIYIMPAPEDEGQMQDDCDTLIRTRGVGQFCLPNDNEEESDVKILNDKCFEICGKMRMDEFCEYFNVNLSDEDVNTIGGYFVKNLGKIAQENDEIEDECFKYCVLKMDSQRIDKLKIERKNQSDEEL